MPLTLFFYIFCLSFLRLPASTMNNYGDEASPWCSFHPKEAVVGVCALCLRERLVNLALEQENFHISKDSVRPFGFLRRRASISLPKVFALSSLLHRLESRRRRSDGGGSDQGSIASLEGSFISIKFEDNGQASWESKKQGITDHTPKESNREKSVVEHVKSRGALRWRKKIGQLLQPARWKRSSKAGASHAGLSGGKMEGRNGWIRSLTRRRSRE